MKYIVSSMITIILSVTASVQGVVEGLYQNQAADLGGSALQPLVELLGPVIVKLSVLVGGIFGLYIILILLRVYYERKNMKLLQHIRYNLDQQNRYYGIPSSQEQRGFWKRLFQKMTFADNVKIVKTVKKKST